MAEKIQTYKNHARFLPAFHFFVIPVLFFNFVNEARHLYVRPTAGAGIAVIVSIALLMLGFLSRVQALSVQDRVIRLEMRMRLKQILPADLQARINDLTARQLVALRFAGDAEMTDLVREVLAGKLQSSKEIKLRVKSWQADWLRA